MSGDLARHAVVTGATSGIGREAARAIARAGYSLTLVVRDLAKGEATRSELARESGAGAVSLLRCNFASLASIREAAKTLLARNEPIHVLLNNAGMILQQREETVDGLEATFAVNHLGYYLFTRLLLDRIVASAPARIVNVASTAHRYPRGGLDFDDLQSTRGYGAMRAYGRSKLANILFTRELARRLAGSGVTVNALHPGAVGTGFGTNNGTLARALMWLGRPFLRTPEQGARTSVHLCLSPDVDGMTGRYYANEREATPNRSACDDAAAARLWEISAGLTGLPV